MIIKSMKDIQEKRIENELNLLKENSSIPVKCKKINKEEYDIDITIPSTLLQESGCTHDVNFLIHLPQNFPFNYPRLYCKTVFSFPHICDGRDVLEDVIGQGWSTNIRLVDAVNRLPSFICEFVKHLQDGYLVLVGEYYLGEKYNLSLLESCPIFLRKIKEKVTLNGKETEISRVLMISDLFFCVFDQEKWNKNNLRLTFWSNIRALVTIKKLIKGDICRFIWKQKNKKLYEMVLSIDSETDVVNLLLDKMQKFGIHYKITKKNIGPKEGVLPEIDIHTVEDKIAELEGQQSSNSIAEVETLKSLMNLYENAVEYYSATNNPKYEHYTKKIQEILKTPKMIEYLDCKGRQNLQTEKGNAEVVIPPDLKHMNESTNTNTQSEKDESSQDNNESIQTKEININQNFDPARKNEEVGVRVVVSQEDNFDYGSGDESD